MATANQLIALIKTPFSENNEKFNTVLQIATNEAQLGDFNLVVRNFSHRNRLIINIINSCIAGICK